MKLSKSLIGGLASIALMGLLAPDALAAPPSGPANTSNTDAAELQAASKKVKDDQAALIQAVNSGNQTAAKLIIKSLQKDAKELQRLVKKSVDALMKGKITPGDTAYIQLCNVYVAGVNEINAEIDALDALIAAGGTKSDIQKKLDKIQGKLVGVVNTGNLIWPPGVSLHT